MTFRKGVSGNLSGRPLGCKNKITSSVRDKISDFVDGVFPRMIDNFDKLDPEKQFQYFIRILEFVIPKMREADFSVGVRDLTEDQLRTSIRLLVQDNEAKRNNGEAVEHLTTAGE